VTAILGISAFYHDSAAALIVDGQLVAAAQEERFTRRKHDPALPENAVRYCLQQAGIQPDDLDFIAFYEKPLIRFERLLETYLAFAPVGLRSFLTAIPVWLREKLHQQKSLRSLCRGSKRARLVFTEHHESHAASAFFPSPFSEAAILTVDGVGEWCTTAWGIGRGNRVELHEQLTFPHSLGLLYSAVTYHCGFRVNSGEYKLMGLAPYGKPLYADLIRQHLIRVCPDGSFRMDMQYFNYCQGLTMTNNRFSRLFGFGPRLPESRLQQCHLDLAASVQQVTEEIVLRIAAHVQRRTGLPDLVLAGGVALNCVANGRLLREGPFRSIWVQPAAGDAGGALGAAVFVWHQLLGKARQPVTPDGQSGSLLGPRFTNEAIEQVLRSRGVVFENTADEDHLLRRVAQLLADGNVVGWFQGRMEFGPRALGGRSILGDPRNPRMQSVMNLKIKFRESFRPFAPAVLREEAANWFALPPDQESPYMLLVADVLPQRRVQPGKAEHHALSESDDLCERVNAVRSMVPAVTHVDYSARLQTVDSARNPRLYRLLRVFQDRTGCPMLVNTSFNVRGEPLVCSPEDAIQCFLATGMDVLVLEDCVVLKSENLSLCSGVDRQRHMQQFSLD